MKRLQSIQSGGFTLLEVMFASLLIGLAIAALAVTSSAYTIVNGAGIDLSTAEFLVEEIRELTAPMPAVDPDGVAGACGPDAGESTLAQFDDVDDFDGQIISPPIDASGTAMTEFAAFSQQITVQNVASSNLTQAVADHTTDLYRITVTITKNNSPITSTSWVRADTN